MASKRVQAIIGLAALLATAGCGDRYEIIKEADGRTVRLNKRTGEVAIISGDRLVIAKTEQQYAVDEADARSKEQSLASPKYWPIQEFKTIGVEVGTLVTSWRDGTLRYQLDLSPMPKGYERSVSPTPLTLRLYDDAGFAVVEIELGRAQLMSVVDDTGERQALSANAAVGCSKDDYDSITSWTLSWRM